MEELIPIIDQIGSSGGLLVMLVPVVVQALKKVPFIAKLQKDGFKMFQLLPLLLGIVGAVVLKLPAPVVIGIITGLASEKGYDFVRDVEKEVISK